MDKMISIGEGEQKREITRMRGKGCKKEEEERLREDLSEELKRNKNAQ